MSSPRIGILPKEYWVSEWDVIGEMLSRAEPYTDEYTIDDIYDGLHDEEYLIWGELDEDNRIRSVAIVNMLFFPKKKVLNIMIVVSDDMKDGKTRFLDLIESFAADNGCNSIRIGGRPGWIRVLKPFGFTEPYVLLEKKVAKW